MNTAQYVYLFCIVVGLGYVLISGLLGQIGGDAHMGDVGGHDIGHVGGHDVGGHHGDAGGAHGGEQGLHFAPFSPLVISTFVGSFGAVGMIGSAFLPAIIHVPAAIGGGLGVGYLIAWLMAKLNQMSDAETGVTGRNLIGLEALVSVDVPASGFGEITYESLGSRFNSPAQSEGKEPISKDSMVVITRIVGNTFFVKPSVSEKLRGAEEEGKK